MEKATVKRFSGLFLKLVNLTAVICILSLIADIARPVRKSGNPNEQGKSNISNGASTKADLSRLGSAKRATADSPITLLSSTVTDVKSTHLGEGLSRSGTGGSVLNESGIKPDLNESGIKPEPEAIKPDNTTNNQSDNSESDTEPPRFLAKARAGGEWESIRMRVTAYCPCPKCCGEYSDGVTACGHKIRPGDTFVAADRRYHFRTEMLIPGYSNSQPVQVLDRGGAIKGNRLDVFFATHEEALEWGVKYLEVNVRNK